MNKHADYVHETCDASKFASNGGIATLFNVKIKGKWIFSIFSLDY
jgi:hypothetical protein